MKQENGMEDLGPDSSSPQRRGTTPQTAAELSDPYGATGATPHTAMGSHPRTAGSKKQVKNSWRNMGQTIKKNAKRVGKAIYKGYRHAEVYVRGYSERRRHAAALHLMGEFSGKYRGNRNPAVKLDRLTRLEVPTWSTSLLAFMENPGMLLCAATGFGLCVMHGHTQDALQGSGCLLNCFTCCISCNECGRQRRYMRKRWAMPGGDYLLNGWPGDCLEAVCCFPLTVMQEAREVEIRTRRKWNWLRGFRGVGESVYVATFGEESLENVLIPYIPKERDVLAMPADDDDDDADSFGPGALTAPHHISAMSR